MEQKAIGLMMAALLGMPACSAESQSVESTGSVSLAWERTSSGSDGSSCWRYDDGNYSCHVCYFPDGSANGPNCVSKSSSDPTPTTDPDPGSDWEPDPWPEDNPCQGLYGREYIECVEANDVPEHD